MFSRLQLMWGDLIRWPDSFFAGREQGRELECMRCMPGFLFNFGDKTSTLERSQWSVYCGFTRDFAHVTIVHLTQATRWIAQVHHAARCVGARPELPEPSFWSHEITTQGIPEWILLSKYLDTDQTLKSVSFTRNNEGPKMTSATISRCRREWVAWGLSGRGAIAWLGLRVAAQNLNRQQSNRLFQTHREDLKVLGELL